MDKDILSVIYQNSGSFSKGQRLIAGYITENYDKAAFMTAGRLGRMAGVSESTVVRFASELGYDGYPGMRKAMQDMVRNRLTSVQRIEVSRELLDTSNILGSVLRADMDRLGSTIEEIDQSSFDAAVDAILRAKEVYIVGMRSAAPLADFLGFYLNFILPNVHMLTDTGLSGVFEQVMRVKQGDAVIGISYPRYSSRTLKALKTAKGLGAEIIGITDSRGSPFYGVADINLFAKGDMISFIDSLVAPLSLINALIVAVGLRSDETISDTFKRLENVWSEYEVYEKLES